MNSFELTLNYLLKKRKPMIQFYLLKYLKYEHIVKLSIVSKDAGRVCDENKFEDQKNLKYLMEVISL